MPNVIIVIEKKSYHYQIYHCLKVKPSFHGKLFQNEKSKLLLWIYAQRLSDHLWFNGRLKSLVASLTWNSCVFPTKTVGTYWLSLRFRELSILMFIWTHQSLYYLLEKLEALNWGPKCFNSNAHDYWFFLSRGIQPYLVFWNTSVLKFLKTHWKVSAVELIFSNSLLSCEICAQTQVILQSIGGIGTLTNTSHWVLLCFFL